MHTCANQTGGNISHLEQMVNSFLPYSQKQLGFDKPVKIVFQSDPSNADVLLGKTAHYNPEQFEVYLYTDKRHPKDVMRSLSHELVHHAQNCRGDFGACEDTGPGYAQRDPHLRKMEREAYTKGNLIFRDFEDLIKRGKITIDINFKDSGEPQMSLKEWKDNELNMLLMKKWGLLKEGTAKEREDEEGNRPSDDRKMDLDEDSGEEERRRAKRNVAADKKHIKRLEKDEEYEKKEEELEEGGLSAAIDSERTNVGDDVDYHGLSGTTDSAELYKAAIRHCEDKLGLKHAARNDCVTKTLKKMKAKAGADKKRHAAYDAQMANCKPWASHPNVVKQYGSEEKALKACMDKQQLQEGGWDRRGPRKKRGWGLDEDSQHPGESCEEAHPENPGASGHKEFRAGRDGYVGRAGGDLEEASYRDDEEGSDPDLARAMGVGPKLGAKPDLARDRVEIPAWKDDEEPGPGTNVAGTKWQKAKTHKRLGPVSERNQKISVREAKEITRRIIERIKKEGK